MDELVLLSIDSFIYVILSLKNRNISIIKNNTLSSYLVRPSVGDDEDDITGLSHVAICHDVAGKHYFSLHVTSSKLYLYLM